MLTTFETVAKTILVIEDDASVATMLKDVLGPTGYDVLVEGDGERGLHAFEANAIDLVLTDVLLPKLQGFDLIPKIRALDPRVPILVMSGVFRGRTYEKDMAQRFGIRAYFDKPVDVDALRKTIAETLAAPDSSPRPAAASSQEEPPLLELPLRGDVADLSFGMILGGLFARRATGALMLRRSSVKKIVYFVEGIPVFVKSNLLSECLGRVMVSERLITQSECDRSLQKKKQETGRRQGEILVEMGSISQHNLEFALELQLQNKLFDVFGWRDGRYQFNPSPPHTGTRIPLSMGATTLVHEGASRAMTPERVMVDLAPLMQAPVAVPAEKSFRYQALQLDPRAERMLDRIDGTRTLQEVLAAADFKRSDAALVIYALVATGLMRVEVEHVAVPVRVEQIEALSTAEIDAIARNAPPPTAPPRPAPPPDDASPSGSAYASLRDRLRGPGARSWGDAVAEDALVSSIPSAERVTVDDVPPKAPDEAIDADESILSAQPTPDAERSTPPSADEETSSPASANDSAPEDAAISTTRAHDPESDAEAPKIVADALDPPTDSSRVEGSLDTPRTPGEPAPDEEAAQASDDASAPSSASDEIDAEPEDAPISASAPLEVARSTDAEDPDAARPASARSRLLPRREVSPAIESESNVPSNREALPRASSLPRTGRWRTPAPEGEVEQPVAPPMSEEVRRKVRERLEAQMQRLAETKQAPKRRPAPRRVPKQGAELRIDLEAERRRTEVELASRYQSMHEKTCYELLGVPTDASVDQVREAYKRAAKQLDPERAVLGFPSHASRMLAEKIYLLATRALNTLTNAEARREYDRRIGIDPGPRIAPLFVAEAAFERGLDALERQDFDRAAKAFGAALLACPEEGVYAAHLAWSRYRATPDDDAIRDAALQALNTAAELAPRSEEVLLYLGAVARHHGDAATATSAYQRALEVNPDCPTALAALQELLPPPEKKSGLLSRYFAG